MKAGDFDWTAPFGAGYCNGISAWLAETTCAASRFAPAVRNAGCADAARRCRKEGPEAGGRAGPFPHPVGGAWPFPAGGGQPFPQKGEGGVLWDSTI